MEQREGNRPHKRFISHKHTHTYVMPSNNLVVNVKCCFEENVKRKKLLHCLSQVDKVCGHSSNVSSTTARTFSSSSVTPPPANSSLDVPGADKIGLLKHLHRLDWILHSDTKSHFYSWFLICYAFAF